MTSFFNRVREKIIEWRWWIVAVIVAVVWLISAIFVPRWPDITGFNGKTFWDLLDLAIVPIILAILAASFSRVERKREEQQAKLDREIEQDRQREAVLQTYLDRITELLRNELGKPEPDEKVKAVARTLTVVTLLRLDGRRNETLLRFLDEARIIDKDQPIIHLRGANLSKLDLNHVVLPTIDLGGANLEGANLEGANLKNANLEGANLKGANLQYANLEGANLEAANLEDANLQVGILIRTNLGQANLLRADLNRAILTGATLARAYLARANLSYAFLLGTNLSGAGLSQADLSGTDLSPTNLSGANYDHRTVWPEEFDPVNAGALFILD